MKPVVEMRELISSEEIKSFQKAFNDVLGYSTVPLSYFHDGECHAMFIDGKIISGFALISGFHDLRSVMQMPKARITDFLTHGPKDVLENLADFTGLFLKDKRFSFMFSLYMLRVCLLHPCRYFIYSYQVSEERLGNYYGRGKPRRIHTGVPEHLDGHHSIMEPENVEILSKWGIIRIILYRTFKMIKKMALK